MSRHVRITHRASGEVIAEGPIGLFGITPFEGNYHIARKYLTTSRLKPNWIPGLCVYKFLYVWLDLRLPDGTREPSIGWLYWLPNPLFFFTAFRPAVPQSSPALSVQEIALRQETAGGGSGAARMPSRRRVLLRALAGITAVLAPGEAVAVEEDVPRFESGRYQFTILRPAQELPPLRLFRLEGGTTDLSALRGKPILLNFWASWCAACRMELPALDRLYRDTWRGRLHVVAVSEDRGPRETVARFVKSLDLEALPIFLDPNGYVAHSDADNTTKAPFALYGMPITYAVSSSGAIVGYMPGDADWSSAAAGDLIAYLSRT